MIQDGADMCVCVHLPGWTVSSSKNRGIAGLAWGSDAIIDNNCSERGQLQFNTPRHTNKSATYNGYSVSGEPERLFVRSLCDGRGPCACGKQGIFINRVFNMN